MLTGALDSVRLHLRAANDVNAVDEKGRSALILAASKGHLEICSLLLEAGADPGLKDSEGNDALSVALLRGRTEVATLLHGVGTRAITRVDGNSEQKFSPDASSVDPYSCAGSINGNETLTDDRGGPDGPDVDADNEASENDALPPAWSDEDGMFDLSGWQENIESPPPPDDLTCAFEASMLQAVLCRHVPIDTDESWDDVEIELPELGYLAQRRVRLTDDARQALRSFVIEALRDARVRADRIGKVLPEQEEIGDAERAEIEAGLHLALGDLGTVIDDEFLAPDVIIDADEVDEEQFGEIATDAVNFVGRLLSNDVDPFALYAKALPSVHLTREDETTLGTVVWEGRLEVFAAIAASPSAVSRLLSDSEAVLKGELPARAMLDSPSDGASGEDTPLDEAAEDEEAAREEAVQEAIAAQLPAGGAADVTTIASLCRRSDKEGAGLAQRLFAAGLSPGYLAELQDIASQDVSAGNARERIRAAHAKAEKAKRRLVEANLRLVIWVAKRYSGLPLMDRIQEGNIGLMRAADRFDPQIGAKFSTYAVWWIRQGITRAVTDAGRIIRIPVHVNEKMRKIEKARLQAQYENGGEADADRIAVLAGLPPDTVRKLTRVPEDPASMHSEPEVADGIAGMADKEKPSPEAALITSDMQALVRAQLGCLEPREERMIRYRFGIGCDDHTLEEVGQMYGVTRERIRQIEAKALKKLGHPSRVKRLRDELR